MKLSEDYITEAQNESIDGTSLREALHKYLYHWKWFVVGVIIFMTLAFLYLRYSNPTYVSKALVLIKNEKGQGGATELSVFKDLGLTDGIGEIESEIAIFKSRTLIGEVVKALELQTTVTFDSRTGLRTMEVYEDIPFEVEMEFKDTMTDNEFRMSLFVTPRDNYRFELYKGDGSKIGTYAFGNKFEYNSHSIKLLKTEYFGEQNIGEQYNIKVRTIDEVVTSIAARLNVEAVNKDANVLAISIKGPVQEKNNAIVNELIRQHEVDAIDDKNMIAKNTSDFINERMELISKELSEVDEDGQDFKSKNHLVNVDKDAEGFLTKEATTESEIIQTTIQLKLANYLRKYIESHDDYNTLLPANLGLDDPALIDLISEYNKKVLDRNRLLESSSKNNPVVQKLNAQLEGMKSSILTSLQNDEKAFEFQLQTLKAREAEYEAKIGQVPSYEREYRDILRQQQIKESLYLYLLQKREENEIALAATVGNTKIIDPAFCDGNPVSPRKSIIYFGALIFGLFLPFSIIYLRDLLDTKVHSHKDVDKFNIPQVGNVPLNNVAEKLVALENPRSMISEAFRILRTNVSFLFTTQKEKGNTIFVTSTIAAEGKTFVSMNLAHTLSLTGKKTVIVGLDLRAPKLLQYMDLPLTGKGVSNYIIDQNLKVSDIVKPVAGTENLYLLPSGSTPPNPSELLMKPRLEELFNELKSMYDYVIVDTAPVSLVTDTLTVAHLADISLYVVRADKLDKRMLEVPSRLYKEKKLKNLAVVINGIGTKGKSYGYGFGYGYGYGYGYGETEQKKGFKFWRK